LDFIDEFTVNLIWDEVKGDDYGVCNYKYNAQISINLIKII